jgi:peptide/nickel transport system permease protein
MVLIVLYSLLALLAKFGLLAATWNVEVAPAYSPPDFSQLSTIMGTDIFGRSVFYKVIHGTRIAMSVGLVASLISIPIGVVLGALAGYFGGVIDEIIVWFYTTLSSIPSILLLTAVTFILGKGLFAVYIALGATSWVSLARLVRGEFIKHKTREYVVAAEALGAGHGIRIFRHILPNTMHIVIINFSLQFQTAIKTEVILSYLGLGAVGQPSWGVMIDDAKLELARGVWWQLAAATTAMFFIVLAFNIFGDALRDALDPKLKKG